MTAEREREAVRASGVGDWQIAQTSKQCVRCSAPFLPEQEYWSTLHVEMQAAEAAAGDAAAGNAAAGNAAGGDAARPGLPVLVRHDHCATCWTQDNERIFWKTRRQSSKSDRNVVDIQAMHQLFLQLVDDEREEIEALRYVVALMLARKKILKPIRAGGGARGDLVFKDPRDADKRLRLPSPDLSEDKLELLKAQLGEILT